ncbi:MAG: hypothetical protein ACKOSR_08645 [Flavobacteriales bacterium]
MLVPINQEEEYAERAQLFASMSDQELIDDYNRVHASPGIVGSKLRYLSQLNEVIESRGLPTPKQHVSLKKSLNYGK